MNYINQLTIKARLMLGFSIVLILMVLLTIIGIYKVNFIDSKLSEITDINAVKQRYAINFRGSVHDRAISIRDLSNARTESEINTYINEIRQLESFYKESNDKIKNMLSLNGLFTHEEKNIIDSINNIREDSLLLVEQVIQKKQDSQPTNELVLDHIRPAFIKWLEKINQFIDFQENKSIVTTGVIYKSADSFQIIMLVLTTSAVVFSLIVAFVISSSLRRSIGSEPNEAAKYLALIASGDLTNNINSMCKGSMVASMDEMQTHLRKTVSDIANASNELNQQATNVTMGSNEILQTAQKQDLLTSQTTGNLSDIKSDIELVSERVTKNKKNAGMMLERANKGLEAIELSAHSMLKVTNTVSESVKQINCLEELIEQIGGITTVINNVSEQTNLLALNAAIEAARAGESGRGFAVVADEVRQLALRTGEATAEIESTIEKVQYETAIAVKAMQETLPKVEEGQVKTEAAMELLKEIKTHAGNTLQNAGVISDSADRQVNSIYLITDNMILIKDMSNNSLRTLENNNKAVSSLHSLAEKLNTNIGHFTLS